MEAPIPVRSDFGERTVNELSLMFRNGQINLEPGFQRQSVWTWTDRRRLILSMLTAFPIPSIFLYKRSHRGRLVYDVIDGKQRLETIFMFTCLGRFKRGWFDVQVSLDGDNGWYDWKDIRKYYPEIRHSIEAYKVQTVEVEGDLGEIIDLFVRINSTGKPLSSGEKRHAKFYTSAFLKEAERLVTRNERFFLSNRVLSQAQLGRMKGTELVSELLMSLHKGGIINKKTALDRAIGNESVNGNTLAKVSREFVRTLNRVKRFSPDLKQTRFRNTADFYSVFMLLWEMDQAGLVLNDRRRNVAAQRLMRALSNGVDALRDQLRKAKPAKQSQALFSRYLLTVQGDTDSAATRERRREILRGVLWSLFEYKDDNRSFSSEQRRLLWNREDKKNCTRCRRPLTWGDFTVDHVKPWSLGGRTALRNAKLLCRSCNSRKGAT